MLLLLGTIVTLPPPSQIGYCSLLGSILTAIVCHRIAIVGRAFEELLEVLGARGLSVIRQVELLETILKGLEVFLVRARLVACTYADIFGFLNPHLHARTMFVQNETSIEMEDAMGKGFTTQIDRMVQSARSGTRHDAKRESKQRSSDSISRMRSSVSTVTTVASASLLKEELLKDIHLTLDLLIQNFSLQVKTDYQVCCIAKSRCFVLKCVYLSQGMGGFLAIAMVGILLYAAVVVTAIFQSTNLPAWMIYCVAVPIALIVNISHTAHSVTATYQSFDVRLVNVQAMVSRLLLQISGTEKTDSCHGLFYLSSNLRDTVKNAPLQIFGHSMDKRFLSGLYGKLATATFVLAQFVLAKRANITFFEPSGWSASLMDVAQLATVGNYTQF